MADAGAGDRCGGLHRLASWGAAGRIRGERGAASTASPPTTTRRSSGGILEHLMSWTLFPAGGGSLREVDLDDLVPGGCRLPPGRPTPASGSAGEASSRSISTSSRSRRSSFLKPCEARMWSASCSRPPPRSTATPSECRPTSRTRRDRFGRMASPSSQARTSATCISRASDVPSGAVGAFTVYRPLASDPTWRSRASSKLGDRDGGGFRRRAPEP